MFRLTSLCSLPPLSCRAQDDLESQMKSIIDAYAIAAENAADPVNSEQAFYQGAIPGMLREPRSAFGLLRPGPVRAAQANGDRPPKRASAAWSPFCPGA